MMVRNVAGLTLLVALVAPNWLVRARSSANTRSGCEGIGWSRPRPLRVGARTLFLERPAIVPLHERALLLGPRAFVADSLGHPVNPLMAPGARYVEAFDEIPMGLFSNGRGRWDWVSEPPRVRSMPWFPRAVVDGSVAHVIWASSDSVVDDVPPTVPSIWYARFDGRRWSNPIRVASGHKYYWASSTVSPLVLHDAVIHLAVSTAGEGITYIHGRADHWTARRIVLPTAAYYGYPNLAVLPSGRLVLVMQGPSGTKQNGVGGAVFTSHSDNGGESWSAPLLISTAAGEPAFDHQLVMGAAGALRVIWFQQTDSSGEPAKQVALGNSTGRVHIAESTDGGERWHLLAPTALLPNVDGLQVMLADDGSLLVALANRVDQQILLTRWSGTWRPFASIPAAPAPFHPVFGRGDAQRPVLTWGSRRTHEWVTTMITTLTLCH